MGGVGVRVRENARAITCTRTARLAVSLWLWVKPSDRSSAMHSLVRKASTYARRQPWEELGPEPCSTCGWVGGRGMGRVCK